MAGYTGYRALASSQGDVRYVPKRHKGKEIQYVQVVEPDPEPPKYDIPEGCDDKHILAVYQNEGQLAGDRAWALDLAQRNTAEAARLEMESRRTKRNVAMIKGVAERLDHQPPSQVLHDY